MEQVEVLEIDFTWLSDTGGGKVTGRTEIIRLSYDKFKEYVRESRENSIQKRMLSLEEHGRPKIEFQSRKNLKGSRQITVYDDFEPYSFFFQEQTPYGTGMCGGVILHSRENLEKAYYGIHT